MSAVNLLPGMLVGRDGPWLRVRLAGGAEVLAGGDATLFAGAAVALAVRPDGVRLDDVRLAPAAQARPGAGSLAGTVSGVEAGQGMTLLRVDTAAGTVVCACRAGEPLPAAGSAVSLAFDPARTFATAASGRPPMRRGPDGPYLANR